MFDITSAVRMMAVLVRVPRRFSLAAIPAIALFAVPVSSQPHTVIGVKADDVLNMRADIDSTRSIGKSKVVGGIPHNATDVFVTGVSVDVNGSMWREIEYGGKRGWVNARFLKPTSVYLETPERLICGGTEPFWDLQIDATASTFSSPAIEEPIALEYRGFADGIGRTDLWAHYLGSADGTTDLAAIVRYTEACSDGMSDLTYDFEVLLLGMGTSGAPAYGCCRLRR